MKRCGNKTTVKNIFSRLHGLIFMTAVFSCLSILPLFTSMAHASQNIPYKINFQGRLTDAAGNSLADGSYDVKFRIWDATSGGTNLFEEDRVYSGAGAGPAPGANDNRVSVASGLFTIQLGDITAGGLPPSVFYSSSPRYLEVELPTPATNTCATVACATWTEGAFGRQPLAASPYAFNAQALGGLDASSYTQLSPGTQQTGFINVSGNLTSGATIQGVNANLTGSGGLTLGLASSATGKIVFQNATNANSVSLQSSTVAPAAYSLTLPAALGASGDCLKDTTGSGALGFGSCGSGGGGSLQSAYNASSSPASIALADAKDFVINATDTATDPNVLINLQCATCSANGGRFAAQKSGIDVFTVNPSGSIVVAPAAGQNFALNLAASSSLRISSAVSPTIDQVAIDNTAGSGVTTAGVNGLSVNYKGGNAAIESAGMRIDFAPGGTSGGIWSGLRIVANTTGAAAGVTEYGLKLEGPTSPGTGTETSVYVGSGWDIGVDVQSGGLQLAAQSDPAVPTAGNLRIYAKDIAGRIVPKWVGPSGVDTPFQASLGFNRVAMASPNGVSSCSTGMSLIGSSVSAAGSCSAPALSTANLLSSVRRLLYATTTTAGTIAYQRQGSLMATRGNAPGTGGFFFTTRFGTSTIAAGNRAFIGLADTLSTPTNIDPTTSSSNGKIGLAINANTGYWNIINNSVGTAPTVGDLGANFPVDTTSLYELVLFSAPDGTSIGYRVTNISTGNTTSGSMASNIPANTAFISPQLWITNNATAALANINWAGWYLESDN